MGNYAPITLQVLDESGQEIFAQSVPFEPEIDVRGVMERAFVLSHTSAQPDPLIYAFQYYGYSEVAQFPGCLGYEVESIFSMPNTQQYYWALSINGVLSPEGADSMQPGPGAMVVWQIHIDSYRSTEIASSHETHSFAAGGADSTEEIVRLKRVMIGEEVLFTRRLKREVTTRQRVEWP